MLDFPLLDLYQAVAANFPASAPGQHVVVLIRPAFVWQPSENLFWTVQFLASISHPFRSCGRTRQLQVMTVANRLVRWLALRVQEENMYLTGIEFDIRRAALTVIFLSG